MHHLPEGAPRLLLTFDDGPSEHSLVIGEWLREREIRALFFLGGEEAGRHPQRVQRLAELGHTIGSHALWHRRHALRSPGEVYRELREARAILQRACGQPVTWLRPPYGSWAPWLHAVARRAGQRCLFWSLNPKDHAAPDGGTIAARVLDHARPGDVLLLHCTGRGAAHTRAALPLIIQGLGKRGMALADPAELQEPRF